MQKDYPPAILEKADKALYYAKNNGRNCTFNYEALIALGKLKDKTKSGAIDLFWIHRTTPPPQTKDVILKPDTITP